MTLHWLCISLFIQSCVLAQQERHPCAQTEICYDPLTQRMKAEWSGINFGLKRETPVSGPKGARGLKGNKGAQGVAGPKGDQGTPGRKGPPGPGTNEEEIFQMMAQVLASVSSAEEEPKEGGMVNASVDARIAALEKKVRSLVSDRAIGGKPSAKVGTNGSRTQPNEIDIYGWVNAANGYQYWISGSANYNEAIEICKEKGGTLATAGMRDKAIRKFLVDKVIKKRQLSVWVGLDDLSEEGVWMWRDGVPATLFNTDWASEQPDDYLQQEDCAIVQDKGGKMADRRCTYDQRALCER